MDIAVNVKTKCKINFFYCQCNIKDDSYLKGLKDVLSLFNINYSAEYKNINELADCILIKYTVLLVEKQRLIIEIYYEAQDTNTKCLIKAVEIEDINNRLELLRQLKVCVYKIVCIITGTNPSPWGILRGVRPTKIVHCLLDENVNPDEIKEILSQKYAMSATKAKLAVDVSLAERKILAGNEQRKVSIYIGIPFCPSRCLYCSFPAYSIPKNGEKVALFLTAIEHDIQAVVELISRHNLEVQSLYIGGGTPTSFEGDDFRRFLLNVSNKLLKPETIEFTVEAGRPDSITKDKVHTMLEAKVTRVSINPQSMQQKTLDIIGRCHKVDEIKLAFNMVKEAGIKHINMDLIAGLPGETEGDFRDTLEQIKELAPDNLTVHTLAVKRGSLLKEVIRDVKLPDSSITSLMLEFAGQYAEDTGLKPYYLYRQKAMLGNLENIGYSLPGAECIYNIQIISERQTIIGIGCAAGTKAVDYSTLRLESCYNAKDVDTYVSHLSTYISNRQLLLDKLYLKEG